MSTSLQVHHPALTQSQTPADVDSIAVLDALNDGVCRRILAACDETPRTAQECAAACDVPLSTVYRKLGTLTDAALLDEGVRVDAERNFPHEFTTRFDTLSVSLRGSDDVTVEVRQAATDGGVEEDEASN
jgi:DNA-binding transcriptional ArsR family regulator